MKFGIVFANTLTWAGPAGATLGQVAEENGFDSLWTVEHVVLPAGFQSAYPYSPDGKMPMGDEASIPDPITWLAYVAASTKTIQLATGILILPQRNPLILAKQVATLDVLSGGRVLLGVGIGWLREEFDALGVPFESRAKRAEECVGALRALWTQKEASFDGELVNFSGIKVNLPPARPGGVPIVVGGHSDAAARRAGRLGDGFFPNVPEPDEAARLIQVMRTAATEAGRDPGAIEVTAGGGYELDKVKRFADAGVDRVTIFPAAFDEEGLKAMLGKYADDVIAKAG